MSFIISSDTIIKGQTIIGASSSSGNAPFIYNSPILVYDFASTSDYSNTGTSIKDLSGNNNNGIFSTGVGNGTPTTVRGYDAAGKFLNLPGSSAQLSIRLPDAMKPNNANPRSYVFYIRLKGYSYNGINPGIIANNSAGAAGFTTIFNGSPTSPYLVAWNHSSQSTPALNYTPATTINYWATWAYTFDGTTQSIYLIKGGVTTSVSNNPTIAPVAQSSGFFIGLRHNQWLNADFNYVAAYNTGLTQAQVEYMHSVFISR